MNIYQTLSLLPTFLQGRLVLWAWLQENRPVGAYHYAGCLCVPRMLSMAVDHDGGCRLIQEPLPELSELRKGICKALFVVNVLLGLYNFALKHEFHFSELLW